MNKQAYLASLKRLLSGLPADLMADILRDYEQHFTDAMARGRSDEQTALALGDPRKVALEFKAMTHLDAFQDQRSFANFGRMAYALFCVAGFNMFILPFVLVGPLIVSAAYLASAAFFVAGMTVAGSGLSGIDKYKFEFDGRPMAFVVLDEANRIPSEPATIRLNMPLYGIHLVDESGRNREMVANGISPTDGCGKLPIGAIYAAAGILLFLFSQKLGGILVAGTRRYLCANARILRGRNVS